VTPIRRDNVVFTPQGRGKAVYALPDGKYVVELAAGGSGVFRGDELLCFLRCNGRVGEEKPIRVRARGFTSFTRRFRGFRQWPESDPTDS